MPATRWKLALAGALAAALSLSGPARADAACDNPGFAYAGLRTARSVHGIRAWLVPLQSPLVNGAQVTASVGVGRATVAGKRGQLRAGLLAVPGEPNRLYYEVLQDGDWRVYVGPYVQPGERHRVALLETAARRGLWRVWFDGRPVSETFSLGRMPGGRTALAAAETWSDGTGTCDSFRYRFARVAVSGQRGLWRRLYRSRVIADSGFAVLRSKKKNTFVAVNSPEPAPAPAPVPESPAEPLPPPAPTPPPGEFAGDWETGDWRQWSGVHYRTGGNLADQFAVLTDPLRQGNFAARFTVRPGDKFGATSGERSEVLWVDSDEGEGDEYWYSWSTLFPTGWTEPYGWGIFLQWHSDFPHPPPVAFNARGDYVRLDLYSGTLSSTGVPSYKSTHRLLDISKGRWNDFVARIHWSLAGGSITVWHRVEGEPTFAKRIDVAGVPTLQQMNGVVSTNYMKHGLYRADDPVVTNTIFHDGLRRGIALDDVAGTFDGPVVLAD